MYRQQCMRDYGLHELQILTSFDHTLTPITINDQPCDPTLGIFRTSPIVPEKFKEKL